MGTLLKHSFTSNDIKIQSLIRQTGEMIGAHIVQLVHSPMKRNIQNRRTLRIGNEDAEKPQIMNIDFTVALLELQTEFEKHTAF